MQLSRFFSGGPTVPGTARANKALVLGATKNIDTIDVTAAGFKLGGVAFTGSMGDLNAVAGGGATGNKTYSNAIVAAAGNSQGTGTAMTADRNLVTGADGTKGVVLPLAVDGMSILVINDDASSVLKVYPATGAAVNGIAANSAFSVGPGRTAEFEATSATQWYTSGQAASAQTVAQANANVVGAAAGYKVARSAAPVSLDGSNPTSVAHGLTTCVSATVQLVGSAAPGDSTSVLTAVINGANIDVYAWKPTTGGAAGNPTLIASTGTETFNWVAIGT